MVNAQSVKQKLVTARKLFDDAQKMLDSAYTELYSEGYIDLLGYESNSPGSSSLDEAIIFFARFGEYDIENLMREIEAALAAETRQNK